jgi:hypothetical protein
MGKYEPLRSFLVTLDTPRWRASFRELERILRFKLPKSALDRAEWWSNNTTGHSHARAWIEAGWRTESLDLESGKVTFARAGTAKKRRRDPWGCMAGTVTIMPGTDLTAPIDEEWNAEQGKLAGE